MTHAHAHTALPLNLNLGIETSFWHIAYHDVYHLLPAFRIIHLASAIW